MAIGHASLGLSISDKKYFVYYHVSPGRNEGVLIKKSTNTSYRSSNIFYRSFFHIIEKPAKVMYNSWLPQEIQKWKKKVSVVQRKTKSKDWNLFLCEQME